MTIRAEGTLTAEELVDEAGARSFLHWEEKRVERNRMLRTLSQGCREFARRTHCYDREKVFTLRTSGDPNDGIYRLPFEVLGILWVCLGTGKKLEKVTPSSYKTLTTDGIWFEQDEPEWWIWISNAIFIGPLPLEAGELQVQAISVPDRFTAPETPVPIESVWEMALIHYVVSQHAESADRRAESRAEYERMVIEAAVTVKRTRGRAAL